MGTRPGALARVSRIGENHDLEVTDFPRPGKPVAHSDQDGEIQATSAVHEMINPAAPQQTPQKADKALGEAGAVLRSRPEGGVLKAEASAGAC